MADTITSRLLESVANHAKRHGRYPSYVAVGEDEWNEVQSLRPSEALLDWKLTVCGADIVKLTDKAPH